MEACKEAGWKATGSKIKCKSQIKWFDQERKTEKENLQSLRKKISHNFNNSALRQLLRDKKKGFKQTCRRKKWESFPGGGTHITRDSCFPGGETHITRDMCLPGRRTHITRDTCFLGRGTHITRDMCFPRWGNTYH